MSHKYRRVVLSVLVDPVLRDYALEAAKVANLEFSRWVERAVRQTIARESADRAIVAASERGEYGTCDYAPVPVEHWKALAQKLGGWQRSIIREGSESYEPAQEGEESNETISCPLCAGEGEVEGQRYDAATVLPATLCGYGIGDGLRAAEEWAEGSVEAVLALCAEVDSLRADASLAVEAGIVAGVKAAQLADPRGLPAWVREAVGLAINIEAVAERVLSGDCLTCRRQRAENGGRL